MRRRLVPERVVGDQVVIACPLDGSALVLAPTAAEIWSALQQWQDIDELEQLLASDHPDIESSERHAALEQILALLSDADLLERPAP